MQILQATSTHVIVSPIPGAQRKYHCPMDTEPSMRTLRIARSLGGWNWDKQSARAAKRAARDEMRRKRKLPPMTD